ncbi:MAG: substrate-binding domain-containing protein [Desulfobacterota bacterium]|nr:substrate-binding domain-containing protein [Thermodesulfobacteriota bacterium]
MKKFIALFWVVCVWLLIGATTGWAQQQEMRGSITLCGAWAMYPTAVAWAEAFQKLHPGVKVDVSAGGAGKGVADTIAGLVDIGMVSRDPEPAEIEKGITAVYVLHDAVYPVVSDKNPSLHELLACGVPKKVWEAMYISGTITSWDAVVQGGAKKPLHVYTRSDSCGAAASWAKYFDKKQEDLKGIGVYGDPGVLDAVKKDPLGVTYSNFSYVFTREGTVLPGVRIVPIDANENGKADPHEIYTTRDRAIAALDAGTYPVTRKNYFFVKGKPQGLVKAFILFALSDEGTKIVEQVGTSLPLQKPEREKILKAIE